LNTEKNEWIKTRRSRQEEEGRMGRKEGWGEGYDGAKANREKGVIAA
jgi:hypothetical protein